MERKLNITKATEPCSCNGCNAKNYDSDSKWDRKVDVIFDVHIGSFCNRFCPDCLSDLAKAAVLSVGPHVDKVRLLNLGFSEVKE